MIICRMALTCCAFLLALQSAWGAPRESQERAARKACLLGDVGKGTEILADLYLDTKNPTHIYNQGRCFEQNGQNEQAVLRFREYLRKAENLPAAEVDAVEKKIKDLEEKVRGAAPAGGPASAGSPAAAVPLPSSAAAMPSPDPLQISQPPPPVQESAPVYKRWWFWSGVGVVVAGGVVAAVLLSTRSGAAHSPPCTTGVTCVP